MVRNGMLIAMLLSAELAAGQIPAALGSIPPPPRVPPQPPGAQAPARDSAPRSGTAVIRGRVVAGDDGQSLRKVQVRLTGPEIRESRLASTDLQGRYEFKDLPAGRYTLTASKGSFVSVQYGQLRPFEAGRLVDVRGTVVNAEGRVVMTGAVIGMPKGEISIASMAPAQIHPDGSFTLGGLAPGEYTLMAVLGDPLAGGIEFATLAVNVAGEDITGIQLAGAKPVMVSGRVSLDPAAEKSFQPSATNLLTIPADPEALPLGATTTATIKDDYTFELKVQPGRALFRLGAAPGGFIIRAVRLEGKEIIDTGLDITPNQDVSGLEIELTNQSTTVTGVVTAARGQPLKDYSVVIFPPGRERWTANSRHVAIGRPDQDGRFRARVPAGDYYATALEYLEPGEQFDPEFLERLRETAVSFAITQGETKAVDLKISPRQ